MSNAPTPSLVRDLLRSVLPQECGVRVEPVDEGGEHSTWWVGDRHVLRLTLDRDAAVRQAREIALRDAVRDHVRVPVPVSVAHGVWAPGLTYTLDTRLSGVSAERRDLTGEGEADLGRLLAGLRGLSPEVVAGLHLPLQEPRLIEPLRKAAEDAVRRLAADGFVPGGLMERCPADAVPSPAEVVVLHNDLKGEHLLVGSGGGVSGVLDWADAVVGDAAEDVAGVVLAVGVAACRRVVAASGYPVGVYERGVGLARYDTVVRLAERLYGTDDSPVALLRAQLGRAWGL
ncbi:phosphotransferase family protein [Streptomyces sp. NPDC059063]|uniref:phosphotransferase family protein n=1 Tax=unclassified Streptomyces TaxID=2593676 RepID=UPI003695414C